MYCVKCKAMYKRSEYKTIKSRLEEPRRFIQVIVGPSLRYSERDKHLGYREDIFYR
ncbi:MAG: hypothetical protein J6C81_07605 [Muribaculaceae bacterium]|nr:hypothetical protein [Muribaculaceae bacterium]